MLRVRSGASVRGAFLVALVMPLTAGAKAAEGIALEILEPPRRGHAVRDFPVSTGLVFPDGELQNVPGGALVDDRGQAVPFEAEATGWWSPEKRSVKWLLLHFRASAQRRYFFLPGAEPRTPAGNPIAAQQGGAVVVSTGPLRVRMSNDTANLFEGVSLDGRPMLRPPAGAMVLIADDGKQSLPTTLSDWSVGLEESTAARASVKARGFFKDRDGRPIARLDLRCQFFRGESFVRLYHTLTWMVKDDAVGVRELSLRWTPDVGQPRRVRLGLSAETAASLDTAGVQAAEWYAQQAGPETVSVAAGERVLREGRHLGGWVAVEDEAGCGVGIALREAWQMFPVAFALHQGSLAVERAPARGPRMGFTPQEIMPPDFFQDAKYWNGFKWVRGKGHFVHEFSGKPGFLHTAEGAARTHELTLFFYDKSSPRTIAELNSLAQHPLVVRQDPKSALRVPLMGFQIEPVDRQSHPDMERAVEQVGRMTLARWPQAHDYGLWRYGMIRWGNTGLSYRWFDGNQYDLQLIPWLLYLRGGDRRWYEEGEATARFAMDVATNHYNTRGAPTGFQSAAAGMPFPWAPKHGHKASKVHYLAYYYHLTGYKRAKEVMDEVIAGNKEAAAQATAGEDPEHRHGHGRELYNMNVFWVNAYQETFDPQARQFARDWLDLTLHREYHPQLNVFRQPIIYLYNGLILQHDLWKDKQAESIMLRNLAGGGYPGLTDGGVYRCEDAIACAWALRQTGDRRFAQVAWDVARTLADLVPDHDWTSPAIPYYPFSGNQAYRHYLMPILLGYSLGVREGLKPADPCAMRDTFISLPPAANGRMEGDVLVRPRRDGDLPVRLLLNVPVADLRASVFDPDGRRLASVAVPEAAEPEAPDRFYPYEFHAPQRGAITIPAARRGRIYKVTIGARQPKLPTTVLVLTEADLVQRVGPQAVKFYNLAGQYYVGTRVFTRSTSDKITVTNPLQQPFTIRDADTGQLLHRYNMADPSPSAFRVGKGRMLQITMTGRHESRVFQGLSPYFARTRQEWFDPEAEARE